MAIQEIKKLVPKKNMEMFYLIGLRQLVVFGFLIQKSE